MEQLQGEGKSMAANSSGSDKPSSRLFSGLAFMLLVQGLLVVDTSIANHEIWRTSFYLIFTPFAAIFWFLHTRKCLSDLRYSMIWILPIPILFVVTAYGLYTKWKLLWGVALVIAFLIQLLISLLPPPKNSELDEIKSSNEPQA
jgi:hypothetical protein